MVNLRFMCYCLARAIKMHLDHNEHDCMFIEDSADFAEFTYNFSRDLKVTLTP